LLCLEAVVVIVLCCVVQQLTPVLGHVVLECQKRLDYVTRSGEKRGHKPPTLDEITQSLVS